AMYLGMIDWPGRVEAIRLMRALALDAADIQKLGEEVSPEVGAWLDPPSSWIDRKVVAFPLQIEKQLRFTQWFRAVKAGKARALIGQLIAVDRNWTPHITPIVGGFEALSAPPGDPSALAACVTEVDVDARRCGAPAGLDALMMLEPLPAHVSPFV